MVPARRTVGLGIHENYRAFPGDDAADAAAGFADPLAAQWARARPDLVHAFGLVATTAAWPLAWGRR